MILSVVLIAAVASSRFPVLVVMSMTMSSTPVMGIGWYMLPDVDQQRLGVTNYVVKSGSNNFVTDHFEFHWTTVYFKVLNKLLILNRFVLSFMVHSLTT